MASCLHWLPVAFRMRVASACTANQEHPVEGNHEKRAGHHTVQGTDPAVLPDMGSAWQADGGHGHHQRAQPHSVLVLEGKPHMHSTGGGHNPRA